MTQFRAAKKLDALDRRCDTLESERRQIELQAFGAEVTAGERRERYLQLGDPTLRRRLIGLARDLHTARHEQQAVAIAYWSLVTADTRRKLDDLKNDAPTARWRRDIWWDALTILWIIGGAGWLAWQIPGAIGGTLVTAALTPWLVRGRHRRRDESIRKGEGLLRSGELELQQAQAEAARLPAEPPFSAAEGR